MTDKPDPHQFGKQAYNASYDRRFWRIAQASNLDEAVAFINKTCGTMALRFIDDSPEAIAKWQGLAAEFDRQTRAG